MRKFTFPLKFFALPSCVLALTLIGVPHFGKAEGAAAQRRAVMISIDGLPPDLYLNRDKYGLRIPNLLELMEQGSYAEAVEGVYPSVTYPSHTTLVTGRQPREHGIFTNYSSRQAGKDPGVWFWYADAIRVPTPVKKKRPTAQLFSNPPPPPPWSNNFMPTASGPQRSITALMTRAPRSEAALQETAL